MKITIIKKYINLTIILILIYELFYSIKNKEKAFNDFLNLNDSQNSVLIALYEIDHLECLPGFINYFLNLRYKVDILIRNISFESIEKLNPSKYIRIFKYKNIDEINNNLQLFKNITRKYKFLFLITLDIFKINFYKKLGYYEHPNTLFIIHHINELYSVGIEKYILEKKVFSLIDTQKILYLNPSYFGHFKLCFRKNKKVKFFITSTKNRNYDYFLNGVYFLKNNSLDFEINVVGRCGKFGIDYVPKELRKYFKFYRRIPYQKMYEIVLKSDFIILNLYPRKEDNIYKFYRSTGNAQLSYGFCKPALVEKSFSSIYKFSEKNSIIYNNNDISLAMMKAATISKKKYKILCKNLNLLRKKIFDISLNNLKKIINKYK